MVLLSYIGGKARVAKEIYKHIPENVTCLVAPFFGGGSVEILFAEQRPRTKIKGVDIFPELVNFWKVIKRDKDTFTRAVEKTLPMSKEKYFHHKQLLQGKQKSFDRAVSFFIVNKCSYNGIMSGSYSSALAGLFSNTPRRLEKFRFPKNVHVKQGNFVKTIKANPKEFLFLDPPYYEISKTYGLKGEYSSIDHSALYNLLAGHKGKWILVYNDHAWVRKKYKKFKITQFSSRYNSNRTGQQLLIQNFG